MLSLCLLIAGWVFAEISQWRLRWQAEQLLADLKTINVGHSSVEAESVLRKWANRGVLATECGDNGTRCYLNLSIRHTLPEFLRASPDDKAKDWLPKVLDCVGLRDSVVGAGVNVEHGVIVQRWYAEEVELPVRDWYLREGAYVPSLTVSAGEKDQFRVTYDLEHINSSHPFRNARRYKGPYGIMVSFTTQETESERDRLMDFRFSCITQFFPCNNEREILPEGALLLDE
jgi:hypothetical protein